MPTTLKAPFPYFGGKSRIAAIVWDRLGDVHNFIEPFFGSGAVLLARPHEPKIETVNDIDGMIANFWRALQAEPEAVAKWADWPVSEVDLEARHVWLVGQKASLGAALKADPEYYDVKIAGWWVWGLCSWIGAGWCAGKSSGINRKRPHLGDAGRGINRRLPHLGDAGQGINRKLPHLGNAGKGINRQRPHLGTAGNGINGKNYALLEYFNALSVRLRRVRVCCGDWSRVCGPSVTVKLGLTGVFLDPPYLSKDRDPNIYAHESRTVAHDVREWAIEQGKNQLMRIALCGYEDEHIMPADWKCVAWKAQGGYGSQANKQGRKNKDRERIWFSPACLKMDDLFS